MTLSLQVNCVVDTRYGEAEAEARLLDSQLAGLHTQQRERIFAEKPFLGVPFTTKVNKMRPYIITLFFYN